ncbi:DUF1700 domain-containing protein [Undibacterium fentianense]|uniref:DUF1700 domain-containing protein n=1 Tax=Undibacterium fentianense TaxID=2828728 RepID=A0A941E6C6_9BURK|nr:DUF1700 domain-containing protein [Undibacterium fentianense]MBR7801791.1 DUF1700 domain-containing protein [Undibacterium fentianense]
MNKTEYINTLRQELQGLPNDLVSQTINDYEMQFASGLDAGKSEADVCKLLPNPRIVAAQKRASVRFQHLRSDFSFGNLLTLLVAAMGLVVFNFFMLIPGFIYGAFLFVAYLGSMVMYGAGIVVLAVSISGVQDMVFQLPGSHHFHKGSAHNYQLQQHDRVVNLDITEFGIEVDKGIHRMVDDNVTIAGAQSHFDKRAKTISIKNKMTAKHSILGLVLLLSGTALLLLCLWMTKWTVLGFGRYLKWNVSLLRWTVRTPQLR